MKNTTKKKIGIGLLTAVSVAGVAVVSAKVIEKAHYMSNRCKVKRFVNDKFDGSPKLLDIVDKLSDNDLENVMKILAKIKNSKKRVSVYGESIKDSTEDVKDRLFQFVDKMI